MANKSKTVNLRLSITFADAVGWTEDNIEQLLNNLDCAIQTQIEDIGLSPQWGTLSEDDVDSTYTEDWLFTFEEGDLPNGVSK